MREQRASHHHPPPRPVQHDTYEEEDDALYDVRLPCSTRRYRTTSEHRYVMARPHYEVEVRRGYEIPRRASRQHPSPRRQSAPLPDISPPQQRTHWLLFVGVAMLIMLLGWLLVSVLLNWWQVTQDDWHYGRPRTYQTDAHVGHNDSTTPSHFLALNLHGHIEVIEVPGGDATHAKVYLGPVYSGPGADLAPVTLSFKDVTGNGKLDLLVHVAGQTYVLVNDTVDGGAQFRSQRPTDTITP